MNLLTPNEIRSIKEGNRWFEALKLMVNGKSGFTDQQWDVILDCFIEAGKSIYPWSDEDAHRLVLTYQHTINHVEV